MNDHPEPRWWCAVAGEMSATRACDDTEWEHSLCGWQQPAASSPDEGGGTVHAVPPHGSANTPCCDRSPFDLPAADRITVNAAEVTCASADEGARQRPDTAALLVIADWLVRTLPGHRGAEQTAATLAYTARWIDAQPPVPPTPTPCPYIVTGGEGTSHCSLAERSAMHAAAPPSTPADPRPTDLTGSEA